MIELNANLQVIKSYFFELRKSEKFFEKPTLQDFFL